MMTAKIEVKPQHERVALISSLDTPTAKKAENWFVYDGKPVSLSRITVPIDIPVYRMGNGRTQTHQLAYIGEAKGKVAANFFSANEENVAAQKEQHKILARLDEESPDSIAPIRAELARTGQTEPILITPTGVVVNGNRRLAAMRELFDTGKHPNFANIECEVLPALSPDQLDDVEDRLQMRPETKLPYSWVNDAIRVQKRLKSKKEGDVSYLMRREKAEIKRAVAALNFADIYLKDWCKAPYDYERVAQGRQFFYDLAKNLKGKEGPLLETSMRLAWVLFDNRQNLGSRVYDFTKIISEKAEEVIERLGEKLVEENAEDEEEAVASPPSGSEGETGGDLEVEFDEADDGESYAGLNAVLDDDARREEVTEQVRAVCQTLISSGKANKSGQGALQAAKDANTSLAELDLTKADPGTWDGIEKQLEEVVTRASDLTAKLKDIREKASKAT